MNDNRENPVMKDRSKEVSLDAVLEAFVMSPGGPSRETLTQWLALYPEYADALVDFSARWAIVEHAPDVTEPDETNEETLILRGMSVARSVLFKANEVRRTAAQNAAHAAPMVPAPEATIDRSDSASGLVGALTAPLDHAAAPRDAPTKSDDVQADFQRDADSSSTFGSLIVEGLRLGMDADTLAEKAGVFSVSLLSKLDRCLISVASIPVAILSRIAEALDRPPSAVEAYFSGNPRFAIAGQHRANQVPELPIASLPFFDAVRDDPELTSAPPPDAPAEKGQTRS